MVVATRFNEARSHKFEGKPPKGFASWLDFAESISLYPSINKELLYKGDGEPFHLVLDIAVLNAVSANGLIYDEGLMSTMEAQLPGLVGLRGHLTEGDYSAYPIEVIYWVGHMRVGDTLYAKGYMPPGQDRESVRRTIANGGEVRTSLDVQAYQEMVDPKKGTYRLYEVDFFSIDLVHSKKAALRKYQSGNAIITSETEKEKPMPGETETTPPILNITEQYVENLQSQIRTLEQDRNTLTQRAETAERQLQEARQYAILTGEVRMLLGFDETATPEQILGRIQEMYSRLNALAETLGSDVTIEVRVAELLSFQQEAQRQEADRTLNALVGSYTANWVVTSEVGKTRVTKFHNNFKRAILSETKEGETQQQTADRLWTDEYQEMAQATLQAISGPNAVVPPVNQKKEAASPLSVPDDELNAMANRFVQ